MRVEERITASWASQLAKLLVAKAIAALKKQGRGYMLSGDSGLKSVWEEVCVQVQHEESCDWGAYLTVIDDLLQSFLKDLERGALLALWASTDEGWGWIYDHHADSDGDHGAPLDMEAISVKLRDDVLSAAADYRGPAVRRYLRQVYAEE